MAGAYALVGGRGGTGEVCLVGVQSDFPAPAVHCEQQRPDRPGPRPPQLLLRSQAAHAEGGSGASSGTPRDNRSRFGASNTRCKGLTVLLRAHLPRKLAHTALEVDYFWGLRLDRSQVHLLQRDQTTTYSRAGVQPTPFYRASLACKDGASIGSGVRARKP